MMMMMKMTTTTMMMMMSLPLGMPEMCDLLPECHRPCSQSHKKTFDHYLHLLCETVGFPLGDKPTTQL
jgi:hypothetical protein